jgi:hypothetical protein
VLNGNTIARTYIYLQEGHTLLSIVFRFQEQTLKILALKRKGLYITPKWKKREAILIDIPFEALFDKRYELKCTQQ